MSSHNPYQQQDKVKVVAGYALQQKLGSGSFATVYRGVRLPETQADEENVAIKAITRTSEKLTKKVLQNLEIEISILRTYRHPNIVCLHNVQKTEHHFYLILEYCGGGDMQGLIRRRRTGRLTEGLTRRLVRDLASGLRFLWSQELIHRDIKPQNLLLTGPLPLDEKNDPEKTDELEQIRNQTNFPTAAFSLKIADFGFARHLQTTSLAETLCGSPLYMAPEILQHHRYDAKADLWSVGTVVFEMICGRPPFNGENHIDLLRNIQRKAVRLPPDVRVSKECVNLLRLLLNRNPLSRAGFKEFFEACDKLVALGCNGVETPIELSKTRQPAMELGPIPEATGGNSPPGSESLQTVATAASHTQQNATQKTQIDAQPFQNDPPPLAETSAGTHLRQVPKPAMELQMVSTSSKPQNQQPYGGLTPLVPSPPFTSRSPTVHVPSLMPAILGNAPTTHPQVVESPQQIRRGDGTSSGENSFVMVEHGGSFQLSPAVAGPNVVPHDSSQQAYRVPKGSVSSSRGNYVVPKGMLSTSPGTGGALMGMLNGRNRTLQSGPPGKRMEDQLADSTKILAASEDVGRRAISVAHLGDSRAYAGMRMAQLNEASASSLLSIVPMEGIVEESEDNGVVTDDSGSAELMTGARRRRSSSTITTTDKSMTDVKPDDELGEMPFALNVDTPPIVEASVMPSRESVSFSKGTSITGARTGPKPTIAAIRTHYQEALSCYLKSLKMLKGSICAAQRVTKELDAASSSLTTAEQRALLDRATRRCGIISTWLSDQFNGVLERANAANVEVRKLPCPPTASEASTSCVEELIYNASLACGHEGAVKHLLGQNDAARSSYRSAGLLAETLLMETGIGNEDRKILEGYVDGFAARITELDQVMLQHSRMALSSAVGSASFSKKSPGVVGLVSQHPSFAIPSLNLTPPSL